MGKQRYNRIKPVVLLRKRLMRRCPRCGRKRRRT